KWTVASHAERQLVVLDDGPREVLFEGADGHEGRGGLDQRRCPGCPPLGRRRIEQRALSGQTKVELWVKGIGHRLPLFHLPGNATAGTADDGGPADWEHGRSRHRIRGPGHGGGRPSAGSSVGCSGNGEDLGYPGHGGGRRLALW